MLWRSVARASRVRPRPRAFSADASVIGATAATLAPAAPPTESLLDVIARDTPGTSLYGAVRYGAGTENPYPIYWLDPEGGAYRFVLSVASRSADVIGTFHDVSGLPWWASIFAVGALMRVAMLPVTVHSLRNAARAADARDDIVALRRAYARATLAGAVSPVLSEKIALLSSFAQGLRAALHKAKCYPSRTLGAPMVQIPFVLAAVLGARHAVLMGDSSFETGGALWFTDLTAPDPYYVLPVASVALAYTSLEVIFRGGNRIPATTSAAVLPTTSSALPAPPAAASSGAALLLGNIGPVVKRCLQTWMIVVLPFTIEYPAGLYILMASSSTWSMAFVTLIRTPSVYKAITGRELMNAEGGAAAHTGIHAPPTATSAVATALASSSAPPSSSNPPPMVPASPQSIPPPPSSQSFSAMGAFSGGGRLAPGFDVSPPRHRFFDSVSTSSSSSLVVSTAASAISVSAPHLQLRVVEQAPTKDLNRTFSTAPEVISDDKVPTAAPPAAEADLAAFFQRSPRFVYYAARDIDLKREAEDLVIFRRTLNPKFPVITSSANSLILRMAGGLKSAPWSLTEPHKQKVVSSSVESRDMTEPAATLSPAAAAEEAAARHEALLAILTADADDESPSLMDPATEADHARKLSEGFEIMWLWSTFVMLQQPIPHQPQKVLIVKSFMGMPWTGVNSSFELPHVAPNQRERARAASFPSAAHWPRGPYRRSLQSWQSTFSRQRARSLVSSLASQTMPGTGEVDWSSFRDRRKAVLALRLLGKRGSSAASARRFHSRLDTFRSPASSSPNRLSPAIGRENNRYSSWRTSLQQKADIDLRAELLSIIHPSPTTAGAVQEAFLESIDAGVASLASDAPEINPQPPTVADQGMMTPLQASELIFSAARTDSISFAPPNTAVKATVSPLAALATTHFETIDNVGAWLDNTRGLQRLSGPQRTDFESAMGFARQRDGALQQAVFLPRMASIAFDVPAMAEGDTDFLERVRHALGKSDKY